MRVVAVHLSTAEVEAAERALRVARPATDAGKAALAKLLAAHDKLTSGDWPGD